MHVMAPVKIREASNGEIPEICHVLALSFKDDPIWGDVMHPHRHEYPKDTELWFLQRVRVAFWDYRWKWLVAVDQDPTGQEIVVGCAQWHRKGKGGQYMDLWWFDPRQSYAFPHSFGHPKKYSVPYQFLIVQARAKSIHRM